MDEVQLNEYVLKSLDNQREQTDLENLEEIFFQCFPEKALTQTGVFHHEQK